jgi:hypothetical protein
MGSMTAYYTTSSGQDLGILAGTYEMRILLVNFCTVSGGDVVVKTFRHTGSTLSGGSAADIVPLHQGAPAASATARAGSLTFSGTAQCTGSAFIPTAQSSVIYNTTVITTYGGASGQSQSPLTLTVTPGSVFHVSGPVGALQAQVWFEELRLPGSY